MDHEPVRTAERLTPVFRAAAVAVACGVAIPMGLAQSFRGLGHLPNTAYSRYAAVSGDGAVVAGQCSPAMSLHASAFRWTQAGGMEDIGSLPGSTIVTPGGLSRDGLVIVGASGGTTYNHAFRWTRAEGMVNLGTLPGGTFSGASGVSDDGSVVVGSSDGMSSSYTKAFRWTSATGMVSLGILPGGLSSGAGGVSRDGSVVVGNSAAAGQEPAFRWTMAGGMINLGTVGNDSTATASAVSASGSVIVGQSMATFEGDHRAFRWTSGGGMVSLGSLPGATSSYAAAVSDDGLRVVGGCSIPATAFTSRAFYWQPGLGMMDLNTYLPTLGIDLTGWMLSDASGISADGLTIVGTGYHNGVQEAWIATIGVRCYPNCDGSTAAPMLNIFDFVCFLNKFALGDAYANCDGSTIAPVLNVLDFVCFLNRFAAGSPYANCDHSTTPPVLNVLDFTCFLNQFAAGCQ